MSLAGEVISQTFHVYAEGEGWRIQESLGAIVSVDASEFVDEVAIGEARLPLELGVGSFVIYPAVYEASASGAYVNSSFFDLALTRVPTVDTLDGSRDFALTPGSSSNPIPGRSPTRSQIVGIRGSCVRGSRTSRSP